MADLTGQTPAATYKGLLQVNDYTNGVDATAKYIQDGEGTDSALAVSTDKIAIGTTQLGATAFLTVAGESTNTSTDTPFSDASLRLWQKDTTDNNAATLYFQHTNSVDTPIGTSAIRSICTDHASASVDGELSFHTTLGSTITEKMRIDSVGNVGIGTTQPSAKLHIENGDLRIEKDTKATIGFKAHTSDATSTALAFRDSNVGIDRMLIDSAGNVGIGTTEPNGLLSVFKQGGVGTEIISQRWSHADDSYPNKWGLSLIQKHISGNISYTFSQDIGVSAIDVLSFKDGNVGIGTDSFGTSAVGVLGIKNGTAPTSSPADMVQLYAEDVTASSELRVRDEAGNVTTLSPHAKDAPDSLYDQGKGVDEMHRVANHYLGTITFTNVDRRNDLLQKQLNGEELPEDRTFKVTETFAEYNARTGADLQVEDWDANQQAMFDVQEEKVLARQAEIDAWDNEEEEAPEPLQSYVKKPKPEWLS